MKVARLLSQGEALPQAAMGWNAVALNVLPVFNPTMGYVNYVVPAVFVLILHQVLLMGTGILGRPRTSAAAVASQATGNMPRAGLVAGPHPGGGALFVLPVTYFFGFCFDHYGIARTAVPGELWLFTLPFLLATTWLGIVLGALFTRRDLPTQVCLSPLCRWSSWPALSGPLSSSRPLNWLAQWAPSTPAIEGIPAPQSDGADFAQVSRYWWQLWGLALLYGALACWLLRWRQPCPCNAAG